MKIKFVDKERVWIRMRKLAREIIAGRRLNRTDDAAVFLKADMEELLEGANEIRKELLRTSAS